MCCATNTSTIPLENIDTCNSDGLCIPDDNNGVWRKLCTDPTWKDPACVKLCITGDGMDISQLEKFEAIANKGV